MPTSTPTRKPILFYTNTPVPTLFVTNTPQSLDLGIIATPDNVSSECAPPSGWQTYVAQAGDTLFEISIANGSMISALSDANCLGDAGSIQTGDELFVPDLPGQSVSSPAKIGCVDPNAQITSPISLERLQGVFSIVGSANMPDQWYYKLEIRVDGSDVYNFFSSSEAHVAGGLLAIVDAELFGDGLHWLRLSVVLTNGDIITSGICEVPVTFAQ